MLWPASLYHFLHLTLWNTPLHGRDEFARVAEVADARRYVLLFAMVLVD